MIKVSKEDYRIEVDLSDIICPDCGSKDFKFQSIIYTDNTQDAVVYATTDNLKTAYMGLDCKSCKSRFSLDLNLSKEEK